MCTSLSLPVHPTFLKGKFRPSTHATFQISNVHYQVIGERAPRSITFFQVLLRQTRTETSCGGQFKLSTQLTRPKLSCSTPRPTQHRSFFKNILSYHLSFNRCLSILQSAAFTTEGNAKPEETHKGATPGSLKLPFPPIIKV